MEIYAQSSNYITKLITKFQNNEINKNTLNKNILLNTIFTNFYFKKQDKKYNKIKELQSKTFQNFFKVESMQEQNQKQLLCKVRDKDSKKIIQESIKKEKENLINDLSTKKDVKIFVEHTYNTYIAGRNLSLGFNLQCNKKHNNNKKYIPRVNQLIQYINPVLNNKSYKMATYRYVESPFCEDFKFDLSQEDEIEEKNENEKNKENDEFIDMIDNVEDELLFYDEKLGKNEDPKNTNEWSKKFTKDEFLIDFFNLKYRKKHIIAEVNDLFFSLQENKIMKKEMNSYLKNSAKIYDEISKQEHYHEFKGYLSEKTYNIYIKKMNYSYLMSMLTTFKDFDKFASIYKGYIEQSVVFLSLIKKMLLLSGISSSKIYESIIHVASSKKDELTFEDYLSCFMPIFDMPKKFQSYKYGFLLYLVKNKNKNIITLNNYSLFLNLIRGKLIYTNETYLDIVSKLLLIYKMKYPKDDPENLNFQHVNINLEYLVNYEFGE